MRSVSVTVLAWRGRSSSWACGAGRTGRRRSAPCERTAFVQDQENFCPLCPDSAKQLSALAERFSFPELETRIALVARRHRGLEPSRRDRPVVRVAGPTVIFCNRGDRTVNELQEQGSYGKGSPVLNGVRSSVTLPDVSVGIDLMAFCASAKWAAPLRMYCAFFKACSKREGF